MSDSRVILKLLGVTLLWGSNYVASAYLLREFSPLLLAFSRLVVTSLLLTGIGITRQELKRPTSREWIALFFIGATSSLLYQIFYFTGMTSTTAGNASLIIALAPIATAFMARVFLKEKISAFKLVGAVLALSGVAIIVLNGGKLSGISHGDFLILAAMLTLSLSVLLIRKATVTMKSLDLTIYSTIMGTVLMLPAAGIEWAEGSLHFSTRLLSWILLVVVALFGQGLAGIWWNQGISVVGASASAMFMNIPPFVAIVVAFLALGDPIRIAQIAGGLLIVIGVTVSNLTSKGVYGKWRSTGSKTTSN